MEGRKQVTEKIYSDQGLVLDQSVCDAYLRGVPLPKPKSDEETQKGEEDLGEEGDDI